MDDFVRRLEARGISVLREAPQTEPYRVDQRALLAGSPFGVVRPESVRDIAAVVAIAAEYGVPIVPHGGNTSYCGGATPDTSGREFVLSLEKLNKIRSIDAAGFSISLDAGVILANAQAAAEQHGLFLPLSLGSEGSCQIGGNVATNAGGLCALRHGVARDLVLGLEVVLPDGSILDEMKTLRKNTSGYDLRQIFVGSEGTLGIVTGVALKLFPRPRQHATAWTVLAAGAKLRDLLTEIRRETGDLLTSFEFMSQSSLSMFDDRLPSHTHGVLLIEISTSMTRLSASDLLEQVVVDLIERELLQDAVIAANERQRMEFWQRRETIPEAEKSSGGAVKHDISVPLSEIDAFIGLAEAAVHRFDDRLKTSFYGHVGDGNVHYNVLCPAGTDLKSYGEYIEGSLSQELYEIADHLGGTFSAEHGVGRFKRNLLRQFASDTKIELMTKLKSAIDPNGTMNPEVVL